MSPFSGILFVRSLFHPEADLYHFFKSPTIDNKLYKQKLTTMQLLKTIISLQILPVSLHYYTDVRLARHAIFSMNVLHMAFTGVKR